MQTPQRPPSIEFGPSFDRPKQVDICYRAACDGDLDTVKEPVWQLLHNPEATFPERPQPRWLYYSLSEAIRQENVEIIHFLLDENVKNGDFPAKATVRSRAFKVLELFLQRGWDINQPLCRIEPSVLCVPLSTSDKEMVMWLLDHGANPNSRCDWDFTPTSVAMLAAPLETINTLFERGANPLCGQLLHYAVLRDKSDALEVVCKIVEKGAPINEIKYEKELKTYFERKPFGLGTPLHRAAETGKKDVVEYLLKMGADSLKLDSKGLTPRYWAEKKGFTDVTHILEEAERRQVNVDSV
ncbi:ankyrin repeat-containing domain protein [Boeremia exigua]|uniref:ankyrin repeat-containing domain protein n=1 Tax=Boeremia exigua TaxID=749465 RepID=UPI001E8D2FAB|nr:ankyrin repeat-containing domain protein [Boeremia exigua]KAH6643691.1 ankyrin repeat-containing domain protein [Boeremia exigua]